jgi:Tol biopolymer transport system component
MADCDLRVRDLQAGKGRIIERSTPTCVQFPAHPVFSPDSKQLAYTRVGESGDATPFRELRVVALDSTPPRLLARVTGGASDIVAQDWTPDGQSIVYVSTHDGGLPQIGIVSVAGGAPRVLKTLREWHSPTAVQARISPDGRFIAYSVPSESPKDGGSINVLSADDGRESSLTSNAAATYVLGWSSDSKRLVFASERGGSPGVWSQGVENGKASGAPRLVRGDMWRMEALRLTAAGDLVYVVRSGTRDMFVAGFDLMTGQVRTNPVGITGHPGDDVDYPTWSPDGKFVAYTTQRRQSTAGPVLTIRSVSGNEKRELRPKLSYIEALTWYPDGRALALRARDEKGRLALIRLDLRTGRLTSELQPFRGLPVFSRDGRWMYYVAADSGEKARLSARNASRLVARELATGKEHIVYTPPPGRVVSGSGALLPLHLVTHDDRFIVFPTRTGEHGGGFEPANTEIVVAPVSGGPARSIYPSTPADTGLGFRLFGLALNVSSVVANTIGRDSLGAMIIKGLYRIPMFGGSLEQIAPGTQFDGMLLSPDQRQVVYPKGSIAHELWVLRDAASPPRSGGTNAAKSGSPR